MIDKKYVASLEVDPQCGFSELCMKELPVPGAVDIVPELNAQAKYARLRCASKDAHNPNGLWIASALLPQFSKVNLQNIDMRWNRHCEVGTFGMQFLPGLPKPLDYDFIAYKGIENDSHPYGACFQDLQGKRSTGLIEFLKCNSIYTVIIGGLAEDYCCLETAKQLRRAGFDVIFNTGAMRGIDPTGVIKAIEEIKSLGGIVLMQANELAKHITI